LKAGELSGVDKGAGERMKKRNLRRYWESKSNLVKPQEKIALSATEEGDRGERKIKESGKKAEESLGDGPSVKGGNEGYIKKIRASLYVAFFQPEGLKKKTWTKLEIPGCRGSK